MHSYKTVQNHCVIFRLQIKFSPVTLNVLLMRCQFLSLWNSWQNPCDLWGSPVGSVELFLSLCCLPKEIWKLKEKMITKVHYYHVEFNASGYTFVDIS